MREMQIKTTVRYHFTPIRMAVIKNLKKRKITSVGEDVKELEPSYIAGRNVKRCGCCGKQYGGFSKCQNYHMTQQIRVHTPGYRSIYTPVYSGIYFFGYIPKRSENRHSNKYLYTNVYIATLFTRAKM